MTIHRISHFLSVLTLAVVSLAPFCSALGQENPDSAAPTSPPSQSTSEFTKAAEEVIQEMSKITGLAQKAPVKNTLRSRAEIKAYVLRQMDDEKNPTQRYADTKAAEAFGLLPKNFDMDSFLVALLTEQIAGLYDPKAHEFYIADWIPLEDQRMVMAHELTHALEDQHFAIDEWVKAAKPNGDAEMAREAVLEGSAMAAMLDYLLQGTGRSLMEMPPFDPTMFLGEMGNMPELKKAPQYIKDSLLFPYLTGMKFSMAALKPDGWKMLPQVFENPPVSTQQILHPELYKDGKKPQTVTLPSIESDLGKDWVKLEEDVLGEFGWTEALKQFLGEERARSLAAGWSGDKYAVYENKQSKKLALVARIQFSGEEKTQRFFGQYSELLEKKHTERSNLFRRPMYFSFESPDGSVFLHCGNSECLSLEGGSRGVFIKLNKSAALPDVPEQPKQVDKVPAQTTKRELPEAVVSGK